MIGDLVEMNLSPSISQNYFKYRIEVSNLVSLEYGYDFDARPIPLTPEILEINGFKLCEFNGVMCYERPEFVIHYSMRDCVGRNNFRYEYVHQIQHALRLCGLNELADNFRIE